MQIKNKKKRNKSPLKFGLRPKQLIKISATIITRNKQHPTFIIKCKVVSFKM